MTRRRQVHRIAVILAALGAGIPMAFATEVMTNGALMESCIRVESTKPGQELLVTRHLRARLNGPPAGDSLVPLVATAAASRLSADLGIATTADELRVSVEEYQAQDCGGAPGVDVVLNYTEADVLRIRADQVRLGGLTEMARNLVGRARVSLLGPSAQPVQDPDGRRRHDWLRVWFATSRERTGLQSASESFDARSSEKVSVGHVDVSIPADHRWARLESPSVLRLEWDAQPDRHVVMAPRLTIESNATWRETLRARATRYGKPGVLVFVHGYNNDFQASALRAAQLAHDLAFPGPLVLYAWPSDGSLLAYMRDEEDAKLAWRGLADVLSVLSDLGPGVPVYIIAHSMGNRVLTPAIAELLRRRPAAERNIKQVVLAAPDIGVKEFRNAWMAELRGATPPRYTLYASAGDWPVSLSTLLHGHERLGSGGPDTFTSEGLDSIDASSIAREWFGLGHSYFGDNDTILSDLFLLIRSGLPPEKRPRLRRQETARGVYWQFAK